MVGRMLNSYQRVLHSGSRPAAFFWRAPSAIRLPRVLMLVSAAYACFGLNLLAQTSDSQTSTESNKSWIATTDSKSNDSIPTRIPTRIIESHSQNGNRTRDERLVQIRGTDGNYEPYQDIEKETLQVDAATVRTTTRTFGRDVNGARSLVQVTEEERHILPGGDSQVVRITSNPDVNGRLQPVEREIVQTKRVGTDIEETNSTVMLPSANGFAPAFKTHEVRKEGAKHTVESQKTTWLPDVNGNWQVSEIRKIVTQQEANHRVSEERVSRLDADGKLGEVSHVVSEESEDSVGDKRNLVEIYSIDVPGVTRDGSLYLVERARTTQRASAGGVRITEQTVEQTTPGDPDTGLRVSILVNDTMIPEPSGEQSTLTIRARDANGSLGVVSVDTSKRDTSSTIQIQLSPSATSR